MADGTYGSPFYQATVSPIESKASTTQFTANVNRKKTRKWVEAKKINYDGSGWGDEDDEDEDDEEPIPSMPSHVQTQQHPSGPRALPSMAASASAAAAARSSSPVTTTPFSQQPQQAIPSPILRARESASPAPASPVVGRESSPGPGANSPRSGSLPRPPWTEGRPASPLGPRAQSPAGATRRGNFVRPSDIYKRAVTGDDTLSTGSGRSSGDRYELAREEQRTPSVEASPAHSYSAVVPPPQPVQQPPILPPVISHPPPAPVAAPPVAPPPAPPVPQVAAPALPSLLSIDSTPSEPIHKVQKSVDSVDSLASKDSKEIDANRFSSSPKLPDLARFSTFSPDLLFGDGFLSSDAPPVPSLPPPSPGDGSFPRDASAPPATTTTSPAAVSAIPEVAAKKNATDSFSSTSGSFGAARDSTVTVTTAATTLSDEATGPTPASDVVQPSAAVQQELAKEAAARQQSPDQPTGPSFGGVVPTAPLNPRRSNVDLSDDTIPTIQVPQLERTGTVSTVTSSPAKESDALREEIIRTLSPVKLTTTTSDAGSQSGSNLGSKSGSLNEPEKPPAEEERRTSAHARSMTQESSYLQSVYDDYWSPENGSPVEARHDIPPVPLGSAASPTSPRSPTGLTHPTNPAATSSPLGGIAELSAGAVVTAGAAAAAAAAAVAASKSSEPEPAQPVPPVTVTAPSSVPTVTSNATAAPAPAGRKLRRRFSWEDDPEPEEPAPAESSPAATVPSVSPVSPDTLASVPLQTVSPATVTSDGNSSTSGNSFSTAVHSASGGAAAGAPSTSPPPDYRTPDGRSNGSVSSTFEADKKETNEANDSTETKETTPVVEEKQVMQAPVRSMLDVGSPIETTAPQLPTPTRTTTAPTTTTTTTTTFANSPSPEPMIAEADSTPIGLPRHSIETSPVQQQHPSRDLTSTPSSPIAIPPRTPDDTAQLLTLRQCMAFTTHEERMTKLEETRHEFALADSGLEGWLSAMAVSPEYSRLGTDPVWEGSGTTPMPTRTGLSHANIPSVNIPSGAQISHKGKEMGKELLAVTGKAGKGLFSLRKKGFHRRTAN